MLKLEKTRTFPRTVEFKAPSNEGPNKFVTQHFTVNFKIMDGEDQAEIMRMTNAAIKAFKDSQDNPEAEFDYDAMNNNLRVFDKVVVSIEGVGNSKGEAYSSEDTIALIRGFSDLVEAVVAEYNLAMRETGNVRAKNSKR